MNGVAMAMRLGVVEMIYARDTVVAMMSEKDAYFLKVCHML